MDNERVEILTEVWNFYCVEPEDRHEEMTLIGYSEIANALGMAESAVQSLLNYKSIVPIVLLDEVCCLTYVAKPPHGMAIYWDMFEQRFRYLYQLGQIRYRVCTPEMRELWRVYGGPFFVSVIDVANGERIEGYAGGGFLHDDMMWGDVIEATLVPVVWNRFALEKMGRFQKVFNDVYRSTIERTRDPLTARVMLEPLDDPESEEEQDED